MTIHLVARDDKLTWNTMLYEGDGQPVADLHLGYVQVG